MINPNRSERGWRGGRRIAVLVSLVGVLGIVVLGSASSASAATVANCNAKLTPKGGVRSGKAKLSFVCDSSIRTYTVGSTGNLKNYGLPSAGAASAFLGCQGAGAGFGCGVPDRAAPGTEKPGTTGWTVVPPFPAGGSNSTTTPTTCRGYARVQGGGTSVPGPNINKVVTGPCSQVIPAGQTVTQVLKFGSSLCGNNPTQVNLFVGGETDVTSFIAPTAAGPGGESTTVGENISPPQPVNMKAFKGCQNIAGAKKSTASASGGNTNNFPAVCGGSIGPNPTRPGDATLAFTCNVNVRAFAVYSNVPIDLIGDEPVIINGSNGGGSSEGALHQCEGQVPGPGYGCGIVDRQQQTATLVNGQGISANNTASQTMGFEFNPCKKTLGTKPRAWLVAQGEPTTSATTVGEYSSAPQPLTVGGFSCKGKKK